MDNTTIYNIMITVKRSHEILTTMIPYEALTDEHSRLIMAQEMAKLGLLIDLYAPLEDEQPAKHRGFIDGIKGIIS